jgi:hypothetical protein
MDPKSLSHLDPKLRETYERVMGTTASPASNINPTAPDEPIKADAAPQDITLSQPPIIHATPATFSSSPSNISAADAGIEQSHETPVQPVSPTPYHVIENVETPPVAVADPQPQLQPLPSPATVAQLGKTANAGPLLRILYIVGAVVVFFL